MPFFVKDDSTSIYYETWGAGLPVLMIAPGGVQSAAPYWARAPLDMTQLLPPDEFQVVVMDQRNAGRSVGNFPAAGDPWSTYADDQLRLMEYLDADSFHVVGCCIGGSFILKLSQLIGSRLRGAVLEMPIGIAGGNEVKFEGQWKTWRDGLVQFRPELSEAKIVEFAERMWKDRDFVVSMTDDEVRSVTTPMLVLPGSEDDPFHPRSIGVKIGDLAQNARVIEEWNDSDGARADAAETVLAFLRTGELPTAVAS
ncbi:alpha/beta fold hydrolase [Amycolatopsis pigmentata]|uniref:Alpha/beta fold hydrolase n=1 Tax=Amycolatopsis pigmentata TaxID=450801 RepID=A0ABW5FIQ1_9PSEU